MIRRHKLDTSLAVAIVGLVLFGIVMIYSSSIIVALDNTGDPQYFFKRQLAWVLVGLLAMAGVSLVDYRVWRKWAHLMLPITLVLLISVFFFGKDVNGANRWVNLGFLSFQPSEAVKLVFSIYLAAWFSERKHEAGGWNVFLAFGAVLGGVAALMLMQPDFGTLTVIASSAIAMYIVAGIGWKQVGAGLLIIAIALTAILSVPYRRERVLTFLNPEREETGATYHVRNISIAIGSGGMFGVGFGNSGQKRLFLPEPHTDSIFAIIVEELGFVVGVIVIGALAFVMVRGYRIAQHAPDDFSRYAAVGITTWLTYQAFLNLSAMLQILPLKGVPLPFLSYGGTQLMITLVAVGFLLSISRYTQESERNLQTAKQGKGAVDRVPRVTPKRGAK